MRDTTKTGQTPTGWTVREALLSHETCSGTHAWGHARVNFRRIGCLAQVFPVRSGSSEQRAATASSIVNAESEWCLQLRVEGSSCAQNGWANHVSGQWSRTWDSDLSCGSPGLAEGALPLVSPVYLRSGWAEVHAHGLGFASTFVTWDTASPTGEAWGSTRRGQTTGGNVHERGCAGARGLCCV